MPVSFTCGECGRDMVLVTDDAPPAAGLCAACTCQPGWFRHPDIRDVLAPGHDGRERVERLMPHLAGAP